MNKILLAGVLAFFAGPAFADPVSAIVAVVTMYGTAATATTSLLAGLAFAGSAVSLIGNVTGNTKLARIGGVVAAGAGIASWAQSLSGAAAGAGGAGAEAGAAAGANAARTGTEVAGIADSGALAQTPAGIEGAAALNNPSAYVAPAAEAGGFANNASAFTAGAEQAGNTGVGGAPSGVASANLAGTPAVPQSNVGGIRDALSKVGTFVKQNKEVIDLGAGLVKGAMGAITPSADERMFEKRKKYAEQDRARFNASVEGAAKVPFSVNDGVNVNDVQSQDPTRRYVPVRGIVNNARGA